MNKAITLRLDGDDIPVSLFIAKATAFLRSLNDLDRSVLSDLGIENVGESTGIRWIIESIHSGSPVTMSLRPEVLVDSADFDNIGNLVIDAMTRGLHVISAPAPLEEPPEYFTYTALEAIHDLARVAHGELRSISVSSSPEERVTLTEWSTVNTERFIQPTHESLGSIEGTLQMVSVAGNPHIQVRDRNTGRAVRCNVPDELMDNVLHAFRRRVEAYGRLQTNQRGDVLRIKLEGLRVLPEATELPSVDEILKPVDLTEGLSIREFVESLRHAGE